VINLKTNKMENLISLLILLSVILFSQKTEAQTSPKDSQIIQEALAKGDTVKAELLRAQFLTSRGNTEEASKIYTRIMESQPDNRDAVQGWLMANMKRTPTGEEEAIKSLEELGRLYPKNTGIIFFKAFIEGEYGHNEEALKGFDKLTKVQPDSAVNWVGKGQVLFAMNNYEEAFKAFDRATSLDPKRSDVWGMKAGALAKIGKFDDAIVAINKGLELSPNNPISIYNRACIYCLKGDKANALADLKKAISLDPSLKESARKDEDFKNLYDDEDFKKLTL
jgi:tetratricopeptide (TPR) repeat protein